MTKRLQSSIIIASTIWLIWLGGGCKKKESPPILPSTQYAAPSQSSANLGETIYFTSSTQNATSYLWNFGDGDTAMRPNASHTYQDTGTYTITFTPFNSNGAGPKTICQVVMHDPGSWTFKSKKYYPSMTSTPATGLGHWYFSAYNHTLDSNAIFTLWFYGSLPPVAGIYAVTNGYLNDPNQVYFTLQITIAGVNQVFQSTSGNGNQSMQVSINNSIITFTGSNIEMSDTTNHSDSVPVNINLIDL